MGCRNAGDRLLPGRRIRNVVLVALGSSRVVESPIDPIMAAQQIEDRRDQCLALGKRQPTHRHAPNQHIATLIVLGEAWVQLPTEIGIGNRHDIIATGDRAQRQPNLLTRLAVLFLKVPMPLRLAPLRPPIAHRTTRHSRIAARLGERHGLPIGAGRFRGSLEIALAYIAIRHIAAALLPQPHQHRKIGIAASVVFEIGHLAVDKEFLEHDVAERHGERGVGALLWMQPQIGKLGHLRVVGRHRHDLGPVVAGFDEEVRVGGPRLRHV